MVQITNVSRGPKGFNVKSGRETKDDKSSAPHPVILAPGESMDLDLHDEKHPVVQAWIDSGDIVLGPVGADTKMKPGEGQGPNFDEMTDDVLRAYIEDRMGNGAKLEGKIERKALIVKAKELSGSR